MRKPVYLGVLGISIVVGAVSLGIAVTRYLGVRAYNTKTSSRSAVLPPEPVPPSLTPEKWTNLFAPAQGMLLPSRLSSTGTKEGAQAVRTSFVLVGTIVSTNPVARRAILWADGMKQPKAFREKEEVEPGAFLSAVERDKVWISRGREREKLDLLPVGSRVRPSTAAAPAAPQASAPRTSTGDVPAGDIRVTRLGENRFSIDEAGVAQLSGNFNQFMAQVRLIPYFEGNRSAGYRIAAIRPGTTFDRLGFLGGDVIQQVNGMDLSSPEKMYTIFRNLKDEKKVSVNILRQNQKNTLTYEIR
ncbi:MAG: hypothetical protein OHK0028_18200 [Deltaproteobacteria bacterium]